MGILRETTTVMARAHAFDPGFGVSIRMTTDGDVRNEEPTTMHGPASQLDVGYAAYRAPARRLGGKDPQVHAPHGHRVRRRRRGKVTVHLISRG
jgi:hypothetical protein